MIAAKSYLIRAIRDWATDNSFTPQLIVDTAHKGVRIPPGHARDRQIVLNISPEAVSEFELTPEMLVFSARFGGRPSYLKIPVDAVLAVFARENGQGMAFGEPGSLDEGSSSDQAPPSGGIPHLRLVK